MSCEIWIFSIFFKVQACLKLYLRVHVHSLFKAFFFLRILLVSRGWILLYIYQTFFVTTQDTSPISSHLISFHVSDSLWLTKDFLGIFEKQPSAVGKGISGKVIEQWTRLLYNGFWRKTFKKLWKFKSINFNFYKQNEISLALLAKVELKKL